MSQKLIDTELLIAYPYASEETKKFLKGIYGEEVFAEFDKMDEFRLLGSVAKELMEAGEGSSIMYPYSWNGEMWELRLTCNKTPSANPATIGSWEFIFARFRRMKDERCR